MKNKDIDYIYILSAVVFLTGVLLLIWFGYQFVIGNSPKTAIENLISNEQTDDLGCDHRRLIDGVCVEKKKEIDPEIIAVMVENHVHARPQSGLVDAAIVYEAPVEANYSRFMLVYPKDEDVKKVGPVRSARPYFLDWLSEYGNPMYMHVGGSPAALDLIKEHKIFNLNEFYRGWYYWRSKDRFAPHNTYTSSELWNKAWDDYYVETETTSTKPWAFDIVEPCIEDESCVHELDVTFLAPNYKASWKFNTTTLQYERYQVGKRHVDQDLRPIIVDTIIVQHVKSTVLDAIGRLEIETLGTGPVSVFKDGLKIDGAWVKTDRKQKTRWLDSDGNDITLKPGKIWIEVVNQRAQVEHD